MKVTKLVVGILMIVLSVFIFFQSSIVGLGNSLSENGQVGGTAGVLLSIMFLVSGIVYISTRKQEKLGGDIACAIMLAIAALLGFANAGIFSDLIIWSFLGLIAGFGFLIWHVVDNKKENKVESK